MTKSFTINGRGVKIIDEWTKRFTPSSLLTMNRHTDRHPLFFTSQLTVHDGRHMLSWTQSRLLSGLSAKGRKATWFKHLELMFLQDIPTRLMRADLWSNPTDFY
ncbi:unnamed protein product [Rhizophagus irregularis]|nr:unnamed protein product [Rhizophagus irregularis]